MFVYHKLKKRERENVFATAMNIFLPILALLLLQLLIPWAGLVVVVLTRLSESGLQVEKVVA